jgi:hypothetical protein
MLSISNDEIIRHRQIWESTKDYYDEKSRRLLAAAMAKSFGHGGLDLSHKITGVNKASIRLGINQLNGKIEIRDGQQRRKGGGRKKITEIHPTITNELENLVNPETKGDPERTLLWTTRSTRNLADELTSKGFSVSNRTVSDLLSLLGYSLQANVKTIEGQPVLDRDAQFEYINNRVRNFQDRNQPVISVDAKKKENIGNYKNNGKEYRQKGDPQRVNTYDFKDKDLGIAIPYGIYDISRNSGWVNVGISHNTAEFAVESIRRWWKDMGSVVYPNATELLIVADGGGSNGSRVRLWKVELQKLSNETGLSIGVSHFPPGTSKWNKIEHRLFSFISQNWRGKPLKTLMTVVNLIENTRTKTGLTVKCVLDTGSYEKGKKISDEQMSGLNLDKDEFHGEWNYTIVPNNSK